MSNQADWANEKAAKIMWAAHGERCLVCETAIAAALQAERERCAKVAEGMTLKDFIGPLFGAGWNGAVKEIAAKIRSGE